MHTNRCQRLLASTSGTVADHLIVEMTGDDVRSADGSPRRSAKT